MNLTFDIKRSNLLSSFVLVFLLIIFIVFKWPYLDLPFFWDEAWVYGPAIQSMTESGPGLLPSALEPELSRGHPLLFHFLASVWGSIFGTTPFALHFFTLCISLITLIATYVLTKSLCNKYAGILAVIILALQPIFLAQSGLVLPEMMLLLFTLLALHHYLHRNWLWYFIAASSCILTKETGLVVICSTTLHYVIFNLKDFKINRSWLKQFLIITSPFLPWLIFLIIQKFQYGWMFFPDHMNLVSFEFNEILTKLENYSATLFIYQGRKLFIIVLILSIGYHFYKRQFYSEIKAIALFLIFLIGLLAFSSLNFYTDRYMLPAVGIWIILLIVISQKLIQSILSYSVLAIFCMLVFVQMNREFASKDHNLGYAYAIMCHQDAVNYCLENKLQDKAIATSLLGRVSMQKPEIGYIQSSPPFSNIKHETDADFEYIIVTNFDFENNHEDFLKQYQLEKIFRSDHKQAWVEIYQRTDKTK